MRMNDFAKKIADLFFPSARCLGCGEPRDLQKGACLCAKCEKALEGLRTFDRVCPNCQSILQKGRPCAYCAGGGMDGLDRAYAAYIYHDLARRLIVELKFGPVEKAAEPLSREMALAISGERFDALVPVPLHKSSERERGMNQSRVLADQISEATGIPVLEAIEKTRKTKRQSRLNAKKRGENVKGAFTSVTDVSGMALLLIDDVRTTGSTARECAKQLRSRGAVSVCLLSAAVAGQGGQDVF